MHKISRIYIGNCGVKMSWYPGVLMDLRSVADNLPTDTIINLENGGGKTILLSLIFSCFETRADKFLKHLHDSKNRFTQYFADDGTPGFIAVEWLREDSENGDEYIVTGQVAANRAIPGADEVERVFFSFESQAGLKMENLPAPELASKRVRNMSEFLRWVEEKKERYKTRFYLSRSQTDWERHLESERGIDIGLLKLQLEFSRTEGGVDQGFMTFKTEQDFVKVFLELTLDQDRVRTVRDTIALTIEKLRRKPEYQDRIKGLNILLAASKAFSSQVQDYNRNGQELREKQALAGRYHNSFLKQSDTLSSVIQDLEIRASENRAVMDCSQLEIESTKSLELRLRLLSMVRKLNAAEVGQIELSERKDQQQEVARRLQAAEKHKEITGHELALKKLESLAAEIEIGLEDLRIPLRQEGALLISRYSIQLTDIENEIVGLRTESLECSEQVRSLRKEYSNLQKEAGDRNNEIGRISESIKSYRAGLEKLILESTVLADEEPGGALQRWRQDLSAKLAKCDTLSTQKEDVQAELEQLSQRQRELLRNRLELENEQTNLANYLSKMQDQKEVIRTNRAVETLFDGRGPDINQNLITELDALLRELKSKVANNAVEIAYLNGDKENIAGSGLTLTSSDVTTVISNLRSMGVKTAKSFGAYIAEVVPDAARARKIVNSNPAKFLGVCVQSEKDLLACKKIRELGLSLRSPVIISMADDTPALQDYSIVVPAGMDTAYNYEAAQVYQVELNERFDQLRSIGEEFRAQSDDCSNAIIRVSDFIKEFPAEKTSDGLVREKELLLLLNGIANDQANADAELSVCRSRITDLERETTIVYKESAAAEQNIRLIESFIETHPVSVGQLFETLSGEKDRLDTIVDKQDKVEAEENRLHRRTTKLAETIVTREGERERLLERRSSIKFGIESSPTEEELNEARLLATSDIEVSYSRKLDHLNSSSEQRLGSMHFEMNILSGNINVEVEKFRNDFPRIDRSTLDRYLQENLSELLEGCRRDLAQLEESLLELRDQATSLKTRVQQLCESGRMKATDYKKLPESYLALSVPEIEAELSKIEVDLDKLESAFSQCTALQEDIELARKNADERSRNVDSLLNMTEALSFERHSELELHTEELFADLGAADFNKLRLEIRTLVHALRDLSAEDNKLLNVVTKKLTEMKAAASGPELTKFEPVISSSVMSASTEEAMRSAAGWAEDTEERRNTTQSLLDSLAPEFESSVDELLVLVDMSIKFLRLAATTMRVPESAPYVGGKAVLKCKESLFSGGLDSKRHVVEQFLDRLITEARSPGSGALFLAEIILLIGGGTINLHFLKMVIDPQEQYVPISKLSNSGGEAVAMAMFLYLVIAQIRAETRYQKRNVASGPLILDNPFAKATNPQIWQAQRALAASMGTQLVIATALPDYNTLGQFERVIRLRRKGQNSQTGRWHIEQSDYTFLN